MIFRSRDVYGRALESLCSVSYGLFVFLPLMRNRPIFDIIMIDETEIGFSYLLTPGHVDNEAHSQLHF